MTDRAQFEAHFGLTQRQQQRHQDDSYRDPITQARWEGWQAGIGTQDLRYTRTIEQLVMAKKHMSKEQLSAFWTEWTAWDESDAVLCKH